MGRLVLKVVCFYFFLHSCSAQEVTEKSVPCGRTPIAPRLDDDDRILGGSVAVPGSWPWQAAIYEHPLIGGELFCGGSLIDSKHVVTASHCVRQLHRTMLRVHLGVHTRGRRDDGEQFAIVRHICTHRFAYRTYNDIAILELRSPVTFGTTVQPVCLPESDTEVPDNETLYTTGWGKTQAGDEDDRSGVLKQLRTVSIGSENCRTSLPLLLDSAMCGRHDHGSACHGDSGAPLVRQLNETWVLEGILSGGPRTCGDVHSPMRFTKVAWFVDWIRRCQTASAHERDHLCM